MEALIIGLGVGLAAFIGLILKFTADDGKRVKILEEAKVKKLSDLEAEMARKDVEVKKMMEERRRLEDEFFKAKDNLEILRKENEELLTKVKHLEKAKEESSGLKTEIKQKDNMLVQETTARQKLQGELSLMEMEIEKVQKELETSRNDLKAKNQLYEGLKGQFNETESELVRLREDLLKRGGAASKPPIIEKKADASAPSSSPAPAPLPASIAPPAPVSMPPSVDEGSVIRKAMVKAPAGNEDKPVNQLPTPEKAAPQTSAPEKAMPQPPAPPKATSVPSDTDFLKPAPPLDKDAAASTGIQEGTFKFVPPADKPSDPPAPGGQAQDNKPPDKNKSKRETLIPGFHPKTSPPETPA